MGFLDLKKNCKECGKTNPIKYDYCQFCGAQLWLKWRMVMRFKPDEFYREIEELEKEGYELIPESFGVNSWQTTGTTSKYMIFALMKKERDSE